jgi:hypothetical protein
MERDPPRPLGGPRCRPEAHRRLIGPDQEGYDVTDAQSNLGELTLVVETPTGFCMRTVPAATPLDPHRRTPYPPF